MSTVPTDHRDELDALRARLAETEEMLDAIREGAVDALVVHGPEGSRIYTLHSAEEPYRTLVEQMHEGAVVLSRDGGVLYANARFAELVGEPLDGVMGSTLERFVAPADREALRAFLAVGHGRCRASLMGRGAALVPVSLSLGTNPPGCNRLNLVVTDLTEIVEADTHRQRAERDSRSKDEFIAMLAHEMRSPLNAIQSAAQLLDQGGDARKAGRAVSVITRQVRQLSRLIGDVLDVERLVAGKFRLERKRIDLAQVVREASATFGGPGNPHVAMEAGPDPVWVDGDATRLEQVITNLLTNAVKYTPQDGRVHVAVRAEDGGAVLTVEDTGYGITPDLLPHVFDLYTQADRTLGRADGGLGLGLTLVRRLVELHGGTVSAGSDGEGCGSTFRIRLPLAQ